MRHNINIAEVYNRQGQNNKRKISNNEVTAVYAYIVKISLFIAVEKSSWSYLVRASGRKAKGRAPSTNTRRSVNNPHVTVYFGIIYFPFGRNPNYAFSAIMPVELT